MLLLRLKPNENDEEVVAKLTSAGLEAQSLSSHYVGRHQEQGLLLSFAGFTDKELRAAAKRLVEESQQAISPPFLLREWAMKARTFFAKALLLQHSINNTLVCLMC